MQNPRLCIDHGSQLHSSHFYWQIFYEVVEHGQYTSPEDVLVYLEQLLPSSGFIICPGLNEYPEQVRFKTKHLVEWGPPFSRIFSDGCNLWHIPNNSKQSPESNVFNCCKACKQLNHDIQQLVRRADATTDLQKQARLLPSSKYPLSKLSPVSQKKRITNITVDRKNLIRKLNRLQPFDCDVNDKQHYQLVQLVSSVNKTGSKVIQELIERGEALLGEGNNVLKDSWQQDVLDRLDFESDQQKSS